MLPTNARVDKSHVLPRHSQVYQILLDMVQSGVWLAGDKLPAETEIAKSLGVSHMTVNKAILSLVREEILYREVGHGTFVSRSVVLDTSQNERSALADTCVVEVIITGPQDLVTDNAYLCNLILSMRNTVSPVDVRITLRQARGADYMARWSESKSDGWLLVAPLEEDVPGLCTLAREGVPAHVVGASWTESELPCVDSDNVGGARLAVDHLVGLAHRDIAILYADPEAINTQHRVQGFKEALEAHNLPVRPDWIIDCGSNYGIHAPMQAQLGAWLQQTDRPTAIFAAGPYIAVSLLKIAKEVGLEVPKDLSIVSFDDMAIVSSASPALTTVCQPLAEMGRLAITSLYERLRGNTIPRAAQKIVLPCELIVRGSTTMPRHEAASAKI